MFVSVGNAALLCGLVAALAYVNTLWCGLVYDDIAAVRRNMDLRPSAPWVNLLYDDYWGQPMGSELSHKSYRPLTVATFRLNYMLHELQPLGYHLVNVLLHSAVCYLYVLLCGVVFSEVWPALIAGLLFAVHPIHTEAVAGVVGRAELLAGIFFISTLLLYIKGSRKGSTWWLFCSAVCVVCAMLSKEQGITGVGVCVVYDYITFIQGSAVVPSPTATTKERWARSRALRRTFCTILFGVVALVMRLVWGHGNPGSQVFHRYVNPARYLETPYRQLSWAYLTFVNSWLLLNPWNLNVDWRFGAVPLINSLSDPLNLLTLLTLGSLAGLAVWSVRGCRQTHRTVAFSLSLLVLPYLPASNLFFPVGFVVAERVLYLPSMGFCMLVGFGAYNLTQETGKISKHLRNFVKISLALLLACYTAKTVSRNSDWLSGMTVYTSGVKHNPTSGVMLSNLGIEFAMNGRHEDSEKLYRASMAVAPSYARGFFNFGKLMKIRERFEEAEWGFRRAIALGERDTGNGKQLGEAYYHLVDTVSAHPHRLHEALVVCEEGMEYGDVFAHLYITHSNLLVLANRTSEALPVTKMAAEKNPFSSVAHYNLGLVHMKLGQLSEAAEAFRTALSIQQDSVQVMYNLASVLQVTANGQPDTMQEALELWMKLLSSYPQHTDALVNLASLYYQLNDIPNTRHTLLQILEHSPNHTDTHYRLGVLDYMQGNYEEAMATFSRVSVMQPGYKRTQDYLEMAERELVQRRTL